MEVNMKVNYVISQIEAVNQQFKLVILSFAFAAGLVAAFPYGSYLIPLKIAALGYVLYRFRPCFTFCYKERDMLDKGEREKVDTLLDKHHSSRVLYLLILQAPALMMVAYFSLNFLTKIAQT
jgi:hypothetical protein